MENLDHQKTVGGVQTIPTANEKQHGHFNTKPTCPTALPDNSHAQRLRLLVRLRIAPIDTITARRELDIMHPAARIQELKRQGYKIDTVRMNRPTECGKLHWVAEYVLRVGSVSDDE